MPRYFFDTQDGAHVIEDDVGLEFPDIGSVRQEAARYLAGIAKDALPNSVRRELAVIVRDNQSRPVLKTSLIFEIEPLETQISD
jgi:hypothetical protein